MLNRWLSSCMVALACLLTAQAQAQAPKRIVVMEFEGSGAGSVRGYVVEALSERSEVEVVPLRDAESSASKLGASLQNPADLTRIAEDLKVSAFVEGSVEKERKNVRVVVRVRNASTGEVVHEEPWTRRNKGQLKAIRENFWSVMGPHILATEAPATEAAPLEAAPEPVAKAPAETKMEEEPEAPADEAPTSTSTSHPALIVYVGPRAMWRTLTYDGGTALSTYKNEADQPAFNLALGAMWFPGAHTRKDWISDLGLELDVDYSIGLKSDEMGKKKSTTAYELAAGAVYRIPIDTFEPRLRVGYVRHTFDVDTPALPAVTYGALRFGAGTLVNLVEWLALDVNVAYLYVLDTGELGTSKYAPDVSAKAFEVGGGITGRFKDVYGIRAAVDFRRYIYDFGSNVAPALPSGGDDDYLRATIAFVYSLPGAN